MLICRHCGLYFCLFSDFTRQQRKIKGKCFLLSAFAFLYELSLENTSDDDGSTTACHHNHRAVLAYGFIVEVNPHYGIGTNSFGTLCHFAHRGILSLAQHLLVRTASAAKEVAHTSHKVLYEIGANNRFASHHTKILAYWTSLNAWSCRKNHNLRICLLHTLFLTAPGFLLFFAAILAFSVG